MKPNGDKTVDAAQLLSLDSSKVGNDINPAKPILTSPEMDNQTTAGSLNRTESNLSNAPKEIGAKIPIPTIPAPRFDFSIEDPSKKKKTGIKRKLTIEDTISNLECEIKELRNMLNKELINRDIIIKNMEAKINALENITSSLKKESIINNLPSTASSTDITNPNLKWNAVGGKPRTQYHINNNASINTTKTFDTGNRFAPLIVRKYDSADGSFQDTPKITSLSMRKETPQRTLPISTPIKKTLTNAITIATPKPKKNLSHSQALDLIQGKQVQLGVVIDKIYIKGWKRSSIKTVKNILHSFEIHTGKIYNIDFVTDDVAEFLVDQSYTQILMNTLQIKTLNILSIHKGDLLDPDMFNMLFKENKNAEQVANIIRPRIQRQLTREGIIQPAKKHFSKMLQNIEEQAAINVYRRVAKDLVMEDVMTINHSQTFLQAQEQALMQLQTQTPLITTHEYC
jgi:hypothetical protein